MVGQCKGQLRGSRDSYLLGVFIKNSSEVLSTRESRRKLSSINFNKGMLVSEHVAKFEELARFSRFLRDNTLDDWKAIKLFNID